MCTLLLLIARGIALCNGILRRPAFGLIFVLLLPLSGGGRFGIFLRPARLQCQNPGFLRQNLRLRSRRKRRSAHIRTISRTAHGLQLRLRFLQQLFRRFFTTKRLDTVPRARRRIFNAFPRRFNQAQIGHDFLRHHLRFGGILALHQLDRFLFAPLLLQGLDLFVHIGVQGFIGGGKTGDGLQRVVGNGGIFCRQLLDAFPRRLRLQRDGAGEGLEILPRHAAGRSQSQHRFPRLGIPPRDIARILSRRLHLACRHPRRFTGKDDRPPKRARFFRALIQSISQRAGSRRRSAEQQAGRRNHGRQALVHIAEAAVHIAQLAALLQHNQHRILPAGKLGDDIGHLRRRLPQRIVKLRNRNTARPNLAVHLVQLRQKRIQRRRRDAALRGQSLVIPPRAALARLLHRNIALNGPLHRLQRPLHALVGRFKTRRSRSRAVCCRLHARRNPTAALLHRNRQRMNRLFRLRHAGFHAGHVRTNAYHIVSHQPVPSSLPTLPPPSGGYRQTAAAVFSPGCRENPLLPPTRNNPNPLPPPCRRATACPPQ